MYTNKVSKLFSFLFSFINKIINNKEIILSCKKKYILHKKNNHMIKLGVSYFTHFAHKSKLRILFDFFVCFY